MPRSLLTELTDAVTNLEIMPSMRALMTSGPALERDNVCGYNCAYLPVDSLRSFDETLYILMCGTGVGFSVERQCISKLPIINEHFEQSDTVVAVADSKAGWARGLRELLSLLWHGQIPKWDLTKLRPAGAKLKTFGVVGGVRRSAMISLSNFSDGRLREAKTGQWWDANSQRSLANNSVSYTEKPDMGAFMREWSALHDSGSGERGIFNRTAAVQQAGKNGRRDTGHEFGTNPCSEIILRPYQFCNLTETVIRSEDTFESLKRKVRLASILGTFQSTLTSFKYLRKIWTDNTEEERLLGVSLTGIMDSSLMTIYSYCSRRQERPSDTVLNR